MRRRTLAAAAVAPSARTGSAGGVWRVVFWHRLRYWLGPYVPEVAKRLLRRGQRGSRQLHMLRRLDELPDLAVPEPYALRNLTRDDVEAWGDLLSRGEFGDWPRARAASYFRPGTGMPLASAFFLTWRGVPVATAQLHLHRRGEYAPLAELGWVVVAPDHRGRGLGRVVSLAVLRRARDLGHRDVFLRTDADRHAALKTYLSLGFRPWLRVPTDAEEWERALAILGRG